MTHEHVAIAQSGRGIFVVRDPSRIAPVIEVAGTLEENALGQAVINTEQRSFGFEIRTFAGTFGRSVSETFIPGLREWRDFVAMGGPAWTAATLRAWAIRGFLGTGGAPPVPPPVTPPPEGPPEVGGGGGTSAATETTAAETAATETAATATETTAIETTTTVETTTATTATSAAEGPPQQ
jgi:hypothetical protein